MLHLPLLISYSRAVDGWYLPWSCGDFQYPEVQNSGREPSSQNNNVYSKKKKKGRIAALKIEMYLWWESTLPMQLSEKELLRQLILRNCACQQATIFQKTTSVWLWGNGGTKREQGIFHLIWDTHAPHLGKRRISGKLTANWNFYNLNHAFSNTFLEKMGPQNILSSRV